jgi:hypothetical protein
VRWRPGRVPRSGNSRLWIGDSPTMMRELMRMPLSAGEKSNRGVRAYALHTLFGRPQTQGSHDMSENNKNAGQNQGQRTPQSGDINKPQKQGGMGEKPVGNPGGQGNVGSGIQDPNKNVNKNPGQKQDIDSGTRQPSSNPNKPNDLDDRSTQRSPRPLDRDDQK